MKENMELWDLCELASKRGGLLVKSYEDVQNGNIAATVY